MNCQIASEHLDAWARTKLADPITKQGVDASHFKISGGIIDARVFLKNTTGYLNWDSGQVEFEKYIEADHTTVAACKEHIEYDRVVYDHFKMAGEILDVGGFVGTVREFLNDEDRYLSIDPFISALTKITPEGRAAYACLSKPLNFVCGVAEFLPVRSASFDWVHMRSMLDHVQVPDLALLEAHRVLGPDGKLLIGLYVDGGKSGTRPPIRILKDEIKHVLSQLGIDRWKDHHVWHPTYKALRKLIADNGFHIQDVFWQPHWNDTVCYLLATKRETV